MAYREEALAPYRSLIERNEPFRCPECPYCNGTKDPTIQYIDPKRKPSSPWDFWDDIIGAASAEGRRPVFVLGPMVDQSELPFRMLCRHYGATLAYTPMLHAKSFAESASYRARHFTTTPAGAEAMDHPLIVQFCANDPDTLLAAARWVETRCVAVDLNLGCPQGIARRGHYGSFLMEEWSLVHRMVHQLAVELRVPIVAKMRVFEDVALTVKYAEMLCAAGAAVLCVHGRTRCMKGQGTGLANLEVIQRVRAALHKRIPVIANGNVRTFADVRHHLHFTQCEGYMCAEPLLWDPRLFASPAHPIRSGRDFAESRETRLEAVDVAEEYMKWVRRYPVELGFVKAHLFKMMYHSYEMHPTQRDWLAGWSRHPRVEERTEWNAALSELTAHVRQLREAEGACAECGPQPKRAQEEKRVAKETTGDLLDKDEELCIGFDA